MDLALINGDIAFDDSGRLITVSGAAEVAQRLYVALNTHLAEWPLDVTFGVDYQRRIHTGPVNLQQVRIELRRVILATEGVDRLLRLDADFDLASRRLDVTFVVLTAEGAVIEAETAGSPETPAALPLILHSGASILWPTVGGH